MNRFISFLKTIQLHRALVIGLAGVLLLVTTACSTPENQARVPNASQKSDASAPYYRERVGKNIPAPSSSGTAGTANDRVGQQTEIYDPIQERKGGMNNFSDVDPRAKTKGVDAKATGLVRNARQNVDKVQNPDEFAEEFRQGKPLGERVKDLVDSVTDSTQNTASDAAKGASRGAENLKGNAQAAGKEVSESARRAAQKTSDSVQGQADKAIRGTQRGLENAADTLNQNRP